jgi:protein-tyrosine phosphatase
VAVVNARFIVICENVRMTLTITNRELRLEVAHNVRHMGGYTTKDGRTTTDVVVRSAGLHRLTEAGVGHLADHGIAAIVDLRSTVERERDVTPSLSHTSIRHITSAVFEQDQSPVGQAPEFPGYFVVYQRMLETGREAYRTLFEVIAETDGRVLFHCTAGKDRTGVAAALMLGLAGVDAETITEDFSHSYRLLEPVLQDWLPKMAERGIDEARARKLLASDPEDMAQTLVHIDTLYGGPAGYLESVGLSPSALSAVKAKFIA